MQADLVLYNGQVYTMDAAAPRAQAVAIAGNRVLAVGDDDAMQALLAPGGRAVDLRGWAVVPGFTDSHLHFMSYGLSLKEIDLAEVPTLEEALARVAARAAETPAGQWLTGRGWDHSLWAGGDFPSRHDLDRVAPEHPVWLRRKCGHAGWANTRALELAGVTSETPDPPGGAIDRDPATGQPTGIFKERAMDLLFCLFQDPPLEEAAEAIEAAAANAHAQGLVGVHTMEGATAFRAFQKLHADGALNLRVLMQIPEENLGAAAQAGLQSGFGDERLRIGGVKAFADGALGARTAYMLEPFEGEPDNYGIPVADADHLRELVRTASRAGIVAFVHAIGDRANREVLDAIEASRRAGEGLHLRHRIEHTQVLHPDDIPRLSELGVIASMQPTITGGEMYKRQRLGIERARRVDMVRTLLTKGAFLCWGTDWPVSPLNPMYNLNELVYRVYPEQRLTMAEAIKHYTLGSAYASFEEELKGSLEVGKLADMVVLSQDLLRPNPKNIPQTEVLYTILGGTIVYDRSLE